MSINWLVIPKSPKILGEVTETLNRKIPSSDNDFEKFDHFMKRTCEALLMDLFEWIAFYLLMAKIGPNNT